MKFTVKQPTEVEIRFIDIGFPVDSEDIGENNLADLIDPQHPNWLEFRVEIDTGRIQDFRGNPDESYDLFVKVVDQGVYQLIDEKGSVLAELDREYVPHGIVPGEYGDYIALKIHGGRGIITNWPKGDDIDVSDFFKGEDD
jgi:hypothetical protein